MTQALPTYLDYVDFEVQLSRSSADNYKIEVLHSPAGETSALTRFTQDWADIEQQLAEIRLPLTEQSQLIVLGEALYDFLFPPPIARCWAASLGHAQAGGKHLILRLRSVESNLVRLPWELIYDRETSRFLVSSLQTPLVRYLPVPEPVVPMNVQSPLRVLVIISSPSDCPPLSVLQEEQWIRAALAPLVQRQIVVVDTLTPVTALNLQAHLRRGYHVLHYIGHGHFSSTGNGELLLTSESATAAQPLDAEALGHLLRASTIRLTVLNACQTAVTSKVEAFSGAAQLLVKAGLPAVVAMQFDIPDTSAITFSRVFYESLADGFPLQSAVTESRKALLIADGSDSKSWATPALFMRSPNGQLFTLGSQAQNTSTNHIANMGLNSSSQKLDTSTLQPPDLHRILTQGLSLAELHNLSFSLGIDFEDLAGQEKSAKARELILHLRRRNRLQELVDYLRQNRPDLVK